jgi:hypothetical protein
LLFYATFRQLATATNPRNSFLALTELPTFGTRIAMYYFMKTVTTLLLLISLIFSTSASALSAITVSDSIRVEDCGTLFLEADAKAPSSLLRHASTVSGLILGSVNGILLTATTGNFTLIPAEIAKWLPLFNEIANVSSTATGKTWIYSGNFKRVIDGIALGGIAGQAISVGADKGPLAGVLTFGVSFGLTYWFPNNFFHPIMVNVPKYFPSKIRGALETTAGQGVIGITMIVMLEQILEHAQNLAQIIPHFISANRPPTRNIAGVRELERNVLIQHALTLMFLDSRIPLDIKGNRRDGILLYLSGATSGGNFFGPSPSVAKPFELPDQSAFNRLNSLVQSPMINYLLSPLERITLAARIAALYK